MRSLASIAVILAVGAGCGDPPPRPQPNTPAPRETEPAGEATTETRPSPEPRDTARDAARARQEAERAHALYGVAYHLMARVMATPDVRGKMLGYMRRGTTFRAGPRVPGTGCAGGWHHVLAGGFVCRNEGFTIGDTPQTFSPSPLPARITEPLPYAYAFTSRPSAPQYLRLPTREEETTVAALFTRLDAEDVARARAADAGVAQRDAGVIGDAGEGADTDASADVLEGEPPPDEAANVTVVDGGVPATPDDGLPDYVRMRMLRGFYVSTDGAETTPEGRSFVRTVRGAYVAEDVLTPNDPPRRRGAALTDGITLPLGFVYKTDVLRVVVDPATQALRNTDVIPQHTAFMVAETVTRGPNRYYASRDGWLVREASVRVARARTRPQRVPAGAKWIHVDLSEQTLVAYEGDTPVYATTVSSGRQGFATPTGTWRIQAKHVSTTMDDLAAGDEAYSIEDVPWTMFYQGGYALHTAFWHNQYGRVRSHGCTNLAPADARFLFYWTTPTLPDGFHGVFATEDEGTFVVIER